MLDIQVDEADSYTVCRPIGELDAYTVGQFRDARRACRQALPAHRPVLGAVHGLGRPGRPHRRHPPGPRGRGDVAVACSRPTLTRLLHTTGFDRIVPVTETVESAVAALDDAATALDE